MPMLRLALFLSPAGVCSCEWGNGKDRRRRGREEGGKRSAVLRWEGGAVAEVAAARSKEQGDGQAESRGWEDFDFVPRGAKGIASGQRVAVAAAVVED